MIFAQVSATPLRHSRVTERVGLSFALGVGWFVAVWDLAVVAVEGVEG